VRFLSPAALVLALLLVGAAPAQARDPGRWQLTGWSSVPNSYWQGVTSAGSGPLFFSGFSQGLFRTRPSLRQTGSADPVIPPSVFALEGYNHVGDVSYDRAEGGRVLLPLECYTLGAPKGGNTCGTGAIASADPRTLAFRYYVKLDPAQISKAMWVEASPGGRLLWTSSGRDLLAYRAADVRPSNAPPAAPIRAVRRLRRAVPPSGVTGAAFRGGRLFLAGAQDTTYQVWSVNVRTGARRLELELPDVQGEAEGLHTLRLLNGELHWLIAPLAAEPSFGPSVGLLHFAPIRGRAGLKLTARATAAITRRPRIAVQVTRRGRPVRGALVTLADARTRTDGRGRATLRPRLEVPGHYAALARVRGLSGITRPFRLGYERAGRAGVRPAAPRH
jgi:hypothetical protein